MRNYLQIIIPHLANDDLEIVKTLSEHVNKEDYRETIYELKQKAIEEDFLQVFKWAKSVIHAKEWEYQNLGDRFKTWRSNCIEDLENAIRSQSINVTEELIQTIHQSKVIPDNIGKIREVLRDRLRAPFQWWNGLISREFIEMLLRQNLFERSFLSI